MSLRYLAFDPGGTTGWALFEDHTPVEMGEVKDTELFEWLVLSRPRDVSYYIIEDYKIRPGVNHDWSAGKTLQLIGALKYDAHLEGVRVVLQQPAIKPVGYGYMGAQYVKGKKGQHIMDALAHGTYWWRVHGAKEKVSREITTGITVVEGTGLRSS